MSKNNGIAYKLQYLMLQRGVSAAELSLQTQVERSTLTKILNGSTTNPRIDTINSLVKYFGVDINEFINEDDYLSELKLSSPYTELKDILLHLMTINGITSLTLLTKYTGVAISILSEILNGKTLKPQITTLQQIANFFNISISQLTGIEKIPEYKTTTIIPSSQVLPIVLLTQTKDWLSGDLKNINAYSSASRHIVGKKSFAININDNNYSPDFFSNYTLIVDNEEKLAPNDFCVCEINNNTSIFECCEDNGSMLTLREAGKLECFDVNISDIKILGVVVQHVVNPRSKV